jgi:hypothetical protein
MRKSLMRRPSPAMAVALVALLVALGGTAYAGITIPNNSVGTKQLKNRAVTTKKIKNGTVTASKINTSGLTVPNALHANSADTAGSATDATNATNATDATMLGGETASAFFPANRVFSSGLTTISNTGTTPTPSNIMTVGPLTVQGSCTLGGGKLAVNITTAYAAGTVINETRESAAGTETLDSNFVTGTGFLSDSSIDKDWANMPLTVIPPGGPTYQFLEGWDALNYPTAGSCSVQLLAIQS